MKLIQKNDSHKGKTFLVGKGLTWKDFEEGMFLEISFDELNLGVDIYGGNKQEAKEKQKVNCKKVVAVYKQVVKTVKSLKRHKKSFLPHLVVENLDNKKNNNDIMLEYMLKVRFFTPLLKKDVTAVDLACDWLDNENEQFKMCDFVDNKCAKARARGFDRMTGCCPANCKFMNNCPCKTKNISCKFIFCDYLENKGFVVSPLTLPIFVVNLSFFQRVASWGLFFKSQRSVNFWLRFVNFLTYFVGAVVVLAVLKIFGVF